MATESPNTLVSNSRIKITHLITEGPSRIFWPQTGISGSNPLCSVYADGVPLLNGDGSPNYNLSGQGFSFVYNTGASGQAPMVGFEKVEAIVPLPFNTRVTNPPSNAAFPNVNAGYPKSVVASFNTTMYPDAEGIKVTIRFPAVYTVDSTNGDTNGFNITWAVDVSLNNGPFAPLGVHSLSDISPSSKCTSPYLNTHIYTLPKTSPAQDFYEWKVRVRRVSQNVLSVNTQNDMYVDSMAIVSSNQYSYPMSATAGIEISADQFAGVPTWAYDTKGIEVLLPDGYTPTQYNRNTFTRQCDIDLGVKHIGMTVQDVAQLNGIVVGTNVSGPGIPPGSVVVSVNTAGPYFFTIDQDPTATSVNSTVSFLTPYVGGAIYPAVYPGVWTGGLSSRQWTDNPAWIFYDLVTNKRYGLGSYIRPEWVDKWTLYQIAQFCDEMVDDGDGGLEPRFTCNVAIQASQDAYTLLNNLVSVFRGILYWANGRMFPVGSETRDPVFNFTNANVVNGVFTYADTPRNTRSTVCIVKWVDPTNLFRTTPERVEDTAGIGRFGYVEKQVTAFATTSRGQAIRAANWILTVEQLLTETVSFSTDAEGLYLRPGDVFNLYDNFRNNQSQGGRLLGFGGNTVQLDKPVEIQNGFTYFLSAIVPTTNLANPDDITGSNQIGLIRNGQIETRAVTTGPVSSTGYLTLDSGFSSNLYKGSVWILNASGTTATVFDKATQYKALAINESQPNVFDILGVKYQTGINYLVNNNYSVVVSPPIVGDTIAPQPPTGISVTLTTGLQIDNSFYTYVYLANQPSPSTNVAYYTWSGQITNTGAPFVIGQSLTTGINFTPTQFGNYVFSVGAVNANGYQSAFARTGFNVPFTNPLGNTAPLSGVYIAANADPYYIRLSDKRATGYVDTNPSFGWHVTIDSGNGAQVPTAQFITGYRGRLLKLGNEGTVLSSSDTSLTGLDNVFWNLDPRYLYTGTTVKPLRGFTVSIDTVDAYGNVVSGARLAVNNPQLPPPLNSGFVGFNGGVTYNVTPRAAADVSGIYLWVNSSPAFTPTYDNTSFVSTNLGGSFSSAAIPINGAGASFYTWFALVDTYGFSGSLAANGDYNAPIYGPISGNTNAIVSDLFAFWNPTITGTYALVTGLTYTFTGASGAQALQINGLIAAISGTYSKIQIVAEAFVTGTSGPGWTNNAAMARYGFQLDANGKVVSMVATSTSFSGSYGTIVFGGADLTSDNYVAGLSGWKLSHNGDFEGNKGTFRGNLVISSGKHDQVLIDANGITVGNSNGNTGWAFLSTPEPLSLITPLLEFLNTGIKTVAIVGIDSANQGILRLANGRDGVTTLTLAGLPGTMTANAAYIQTGLATSDIATTTWKGDPGLNTAGFYVQNNQAAGGFNSVGYAGPSFITLGRAGGTFASIGNISANAKVGSIAARAYTSGSWNEQGLIQYGITVGGDYPYIKIMTEDAASTNIQSIVLNYDGKLYFQPPNDTFSPNSAVYPTPPYVAEPSTNLYRSSANNLSTDGTFNALAVYASNALLTNGNLTALGNIRFGTFTATPATSAGYITITDVGGTTRKLMVGT